MGSDDFGNILEDFERGQELTGKAKKLSGQVIRQHAEPKAPAKARYQAPAEEEDFGAALAQFDRDSKSTVANEKPPKPGDSVRGRILSLDLEVAFIDLGTKAEGVVDTTLLTDEDGVLLHKAGDTLRLQVVGVEPSGALRLRPAGAAVGHGSALQKGDTVEGVVREVNKGGVEVDLSGRKGFCPISQLADRYVEDANEFVGRKLRFEIQRYEDGGPGRKPNIVLSRRVLLAKEKEERAAITWETLEVGSIIEGKVTSLMDFGAFIDLGGIDGMLHISELGYQRPGHPQEVLAVGQTVEVKIIELQRRDDDRHRISLSMKSLQRDPWIDGVQKFTVGSICPGKVLRLEAFGAFVELEPGIEGLAHISELGGGRRISHPREVLQKGQELAVRVLGFDVAKRRISLAPADDNDVAESQASVREFLEQSAPSGKGFGAMAHFFKDSKKD